MAKRTKKEQRDRKRKRWLIAAPFLVLAAMFWPLIGIIPTEGPVAPDPVTVTEYRAQYDVAADGSMTATETIIGKFPGGRHGIFRFWDRTDPRDPGLRYEPTVLAVAMDGHAEPFELLDQGAGRYLVAKIGNADVLLPIGQHVYEIRYSMPAVITPAGAGPVPGFASSAGSPSGARSVFWWNVVANGWRMPIQSARIVVNLPAAAVSVACSAATRIPGQEGPCAISGAGTRSLVLSAKQIPAFGGMTVRAGMTPPPPAQPTTPWPWQLDRMLGRSAGQVLLIVLAALGAVALGLAWVLATRERKPGLPVLYEPPDGLGPVQTMYLAEETPGDHDIAASLFQLAEDGMITISTRSRSWTAAATDRVTADALASMDPVGRAVLAGLRLDTAGAEFKASQSRAVGEVLANTRKAIRHAVVAWATDAKLVRLSAVGVSGRILWIASVLAIPVTLTGWYAPTILTLVPLGFAVGGYRLMRAGAIRRRTRRGRELWTRAGGFRRMLATPSSELRFDFSARKELFLPYLPYAVAFGVAMQWSDKYSDEVDEPPPAPGWLNYSGRTITAATMLRTVGSFESTVTSTISAYQSASSGSSSGGWSSGGGSSVGSGGGGGGGGSW